MKEVCDNLGLNYASWAVITQCEVFKAKVKELTNEIEQRVLDKLPEDPVFLKMKLAQAKAVNRVVAEIDNEIDGSANTRLNASFGLLDRIGYGKKEQDTGTKVAVVVISEGKASAMAGFERVVDVTGDVDLSAKSEGEKIS